jgi:hypothetical protein
VITLPKSLPLLIGCVLFLNASTVAKHDGGNVGGRCCAADRSTKTGFPESWQIAAVINVSMRQNDRIQISRLAAESLVARPGILLATLEQPAVKQDTSFSGFQQMLAAGHFTGSSKECQFHDSGLGCVSGGQPVQCRMLHRSMHR